MVRGRPSGLKAAPHPLRGGLRPALTPETSAAPGGRTQRAGTRPAPAQRTAPPHPHTTGNVNTETVITRTVATTP